VPARSFRLLAVCAGICALAVPAAAAGARTAAPPIALGVSVSDPGRSADLQSYVSSVGRRPAMVMWFQSFDEPLYYAGQLAAVHRLGAAPMVTWEPAHGPAPVPLQSIAAGAEDAYLRRAAAAATRWHGPLFVRFAAEMNVASSPWGPGTPGDTPADYVAAWRHVVSVFRQAGATNVRWVWSPNVDCGGRCPFAAYYPGDRWVDWVALDGYNYAAADDLPWMSFAQIFGPSYDRLEALTRKPLLIAETSSGEAGGDKAAWIRQSFLQTIPARLPNVRAVVWWQHDDPEADWRVNSSAPALAAFRGVAASPRYAGTAAALSDPTARPAAKTVARFQTCVARTKPSVSGCAPSRR
jgi:hypothetical protein